MLDVHLTTNTTVYNIIGRGSSPSKVINHFSEFLLRWFKLVLTHDIVKTRKSQKFQERTQKHPCDAWLNGFSKSFFERGIGITEKTYKTRRDRWGGNVNHKSLF